MLHCIMMLHGMQTSHITPQQAGSILAKVQPKVAVAHHAKVNDASRAALVTELRQANYPEVKDHCPVP